MSIQNLNKLLTDFDNLANATEDTPTPFVAIGTRNAITSIGPANDYYPLPSEELNEGCLEELRDLASAFLNLGNVRLNHLPPHPPNAFIYQLFSDDETRIFKAADVFFFGTKQTLRVIDRLNQWGMEVLELFPPDAPDERLVFGMTYSHVERGNDKTIRRLVRKCSLQHGIVKEHFTPVELQVENGLFPASQCVSHQSDGLPPDLTLKVEVIEADAVDDGAESITNVSFYQSTNRQYDTWGTFPPKHYYFFHLAANNLAFAVKNAIELLRENNSSEEASELVSGRHFSMGDVKSTENAGDQNWPVGNTEHPPNWRTAPVYDDVPEWGGEEGKVDNYGGELERDRFLFWKWQCGRFGWEEIIKAAVAKGYVLWKDSAKAFENGEINTDYVRTRTRRLAEKYAEAIKITLRPGKRQPAKKQAVVPQTRVASAKRISSTPVPGDSPE